MNRPKRPLIALTLLIAILLNIFPLLSVAAPAYASTSNSGTRDEPCITLEGTGATNYYHDTYSYDRLSALSPDALYSALESLMTDTHKKLTSYSDYRDYAVRTDSEGENGKITLLYT